MEYSLGFIIGAIFAAFLISLSAIIGLKITQGMEKIDVESSWMQLNKNIKKMVDNVYVQAEGSSVKFNPMLTPNQILCFLNENNPLSSDMVEDDKNFLQYLRDEWEDGEFPNLYYRDNNIKRYAYIEHLKPSQTICLLTNNNLVYFENKGTYVDVVK